MDMKEVASVLKKLKDIAKAALERGGRGKERAASLQVVAERFETAARDTDAYETADRETNENRASQKAGPRLGALLKTRNMKIGEVVSKWDADGSGSVDVGEFRHHLRNLGFKATDAEIDGVFREVRVRNRLESWPAAHPLVL